MGAVNAPTIQYVKTGDGVNIAYYAIGQGPPFVWMELPSHLQAEWKLLPEQRRNYEGVSRIATLVRYDHRGFGLSERDISAFPLDALVSDLEAVVDKLGLTTFVLAGVGGFTGPVAISYAAAHPERVSHLVLMLGLARIPPPLHQQVQALLLPSSDWRFVSESLLRLALGWDDEEASRAIAAFWREASTIDAFRAFWRDAGQWDVRDLLPSVMMPTLLIHMADSPMAGPEQSREIASLMPDARAALVDGPTSAERSAQYQTAIASFLFGPDAARPEPAAVAAPQGTAIILFADIAESTALTERLGDAAFRERARELDGALRQAITSNGGTAIEGKLLGDGVLAVFGAAREAIACAAAIHVAGSHVGLPLHVGIHAGDVIREANNVYGGAVNIAARVAGEAAAGETLVSQTVRDLARTSAGVSFEDRGERELKGVSEAVRVFAVREQA
jgi:class 3 adenylate cyclase